MTVIEFAENRLAEELEQNKKGAINDEIIKYWVAYLDGARAQAYQEKEKAACKKENM